MLSLPGSPSPKNLNPKLLIAEAKAPLAQDLPLYPKSDQNQAWDPSDSSAPSVPHIARIEVQQSLTYKVGGANGPCD